MYRFDTGGEFCYNRCMYIEFVIADNFVLTYLAGATAARFGHVGTKRWRLLVAAALGTAVAVFYPFIGNKYIELAVKLVLYFALCATMYAKTARPITASLLFLGCTFAFGGASYALGLMLFADGGKAAAFCAKYPLFITLGGGAAVCAGARYTIKRLRQARARAPYEYETDVEIFGSTLKFNAFLDTGNCVFDGKTGLPVVITAVELFADKLDGNAAAEFLKSVDGLRKITAKTPAGETTVYVLQPTKITVYSDRHGHKIKALVGLVGGGDKRFSAAHEMLLNPTAVAEGV